MPPKIASSKHSADRGHDNRGHVEALLVPEAQKARKDEAAQEGADDADEEIGEQTVPVRALQPCFRRRSSPQGSELIGTFASVAGNEAAIRFGRKRLIVTAMLASILIGGTIGFVGSMSYAVAAVLITLYGIVIWLNLLIPHGGNSGYSRAFAARRHARRPLHARLRQPRRTVLRSKGACASSASSFSL